MLSSYVITLREGLEAFLIVAITLAYLRKRGSTRLIPAVYWGVVGAIGLSAAAGVVFAGISNQALWEGTLTIVAAVMVASLTIRMWSAAKRIKLDIETRLHESSRHPGTAAFIGVFLFILFMITREGMEMALLMNALLFQVKSISLIIGALGGIVTAAGIAWLWSRHGHRVDLALFFQVTAIFLLVFVVQLLIYGFHELTEANVMPYSEALHWATEPYGPEGQYGRYISLMLLLVPLGWLTVSSLLRRGRR